MFNPFTFSSNCIIKWGKVFKNGPSKICERQQFGVFDNLWGWRLKG